MSRVTNYLQVVGSDAGYKHDDRPDVEAMRNAGLVVNYLFKELKAIFPAWKNSFDSDVTEDSVKQNWIKTFILAGITNIDQIRLGVNACRLSDKPFMPSAGEFVSWCKPTPEMLGLPSAEQAYRQACALSHPAADRTQAHAAVFHAAKEAGMYLLANQPEHVSRPVFDYHYSLVMQMVLRGEQLAETPKAITKQVSPKADLSTGNMAIAEMRKRLGMKR